ncbi:hypothetical protein A2U01_0104244, partial [Trifolium medium]|nr:hypothetical protein [Trifolium medium]
TGADIAKVDNEENNPEEKQKKGKRIFKVKQEKIIEAKTSGNASVSGAGASEAMSSEVKKATETAATEDGGASEV